MARDVSDLDALRVNLGVARVCVLGHSYGGFVALRYALDHPERVNALVLYSTTPTTGSEWQGAINDNLHRLFENKPWFAETMGAMDAEASAHSDSELNAAIARELPVFLADYDADRARYDQHFGGAHVELAVMRRPGEQFEVTSQLRAIQSPTLIIAGARDFLCGPRWGRVLEQGIPNAHMVVLEHSGHMALFEETAGFVRAVHDFFASQSARAD
jgi:proline iminopeptidase